MLRGQPVTAIIPVRGGSKGIPRKNLRQIAGRSLLERAIALGKATKRVDRMIVSTDDLEMQAVARKHGVASPSLRPAGLATDTATAKSVVEHVIEECGIENGYVLLLQATSPLRTLGDLEGLINAFEASDADAAVSVAAHDEPRPEKLKRIEDGWLRPYMGDGFEGPRQSLPQPYALNGAFYLVSLDAFRREGRFIPKRTLPFVMPQERSHNLDSLTDWQILEAMVQAGHWKLEDLPL
ncbi:MAG: acylneuraminate cytidylyltransferase family protein [Rhizobiales bacterium]|nr:acylneuraminate cytidylyltransferase family protein [Hyphomicrobiales bacterium]